MKKKYMMPSIDITEVLIDTVLTGEVFTRS